MTVTVALAGNPNVGKSTIFNALTGSRQHVGNWPGKTVEKKEGSLKIGESDIVLVDLPGTYSLSAYSVEEIITRDFIINEQPTAVITVVDASNLERNLYLVAQMIELEVPVVIALNMTDIAGSRGLQIDAKRLSQELGGIPVVETIGSRNIGLEELKLAILQVSQNTPPAVTPFRYEGILQQEISVLETEIEAYDALTAHYYPNWMATKLLEDDEAVIEIVRAFDAQDLLLAVESAQARIEAATGEDAEILIADQRYEFIGEIIDEVQQQPSEAVITISDKVDAVVTHRIWGLPIFLFIMWLVFQITANVSAPYLDWIDSFFSETFYGWGEALMTAIGLGGTWVSDLVTDGIIAGVGGVLVFVPVLLFLYICLGLLEDSGYLTRAAFVMDRIMRWMGLHGKSFLPMIVGFGCTVPAVYATRALENDKDRKITGFLATFMSCGARLPVYILFGAAFFGASSFNLVFAMYLLGILIALLVGLGFKHTVYKGKEPAPFVMELPPYRIPHPRDVWRQTWERTKGFIVNAGTVILGVSVILWLLMAIPTRPGAGSFNDVAPEESVFGAVSGFIAPVFEPAGFGSWQASGSLITGFLAKEIIVSSMNQIYVGTRDFVEEESAPSTISDDLVASAVTFAEAGILTLQEIANIVPRTINLLPAVELQEFNFLGIEEEEDDNGSLQNALVSSFTKSAGSPAAASVAAVAFTVFVLLYVPCMAAVSAMRQEFGSRWMLAQIAFTLTLAWLAAVIVFQVGKMIFV
jgi:ferrous iron transport protein B